MTQPTHIEEVRGKTPKQIIMEYVDRSDVIGLADFAVALLEDFDSQKEEMVKKIEEKKWSTLRSASINKQDSIDHNKDLDDILDIIRDNEK